MGTDTNIMVMIIDIIKITMITTISSCRRIVLHHRHLERHRREQEREREKPKNGLRHEVNLANIIFIIIIMGCTQNPISTLSHIWVFVRLYGIMFVIIVIIIIIIIIYTKVEVSTL